MRAPEIARASPMARTGVAGQKRALDAIFGCKSRTIGRSFMRRSAMNPELTPGKRFPDVELHDHGGHKRRLSELAGGDPLLLNFYRGWW
ncbi:MAG TPA: hypothetical protein VKI99_02215 [Candidatus Dormibacteraeota bacterium]|nr:hypothetical protein [Candidatus Dormibacteraeota bacterium]